MNKPRRIIIEDDDDDNNEDVVVIDSDGDNDAVDTRKVFSIIISIKIFIIILLSL